MTKTLKNLIALNQNIKIYVPSTINVNETMDTSAQVEEALTLLSSLFGGATTYQAFGAWLSDSGQLIKENVFICECFCKEAQIQEHIEKVYNFCIKLKLDLRQEAIALEVNKIMHFV